MQELFSTRQNPMIDPALHIWGWEIPVYLFLGGLVAGTMIISGYFTFKGHHKHSYFSCFYLPHVSLVLLSAGMFALFLDLEHKFYVWRLYTTFEVTSPMSWGSWVLVLVYPTLLASTLVKIPEPFQNRIKLFDKISARINQHPFLIKNIGAVSMIVGAILGMYTGVLLSGLQARPLWNSSMLWVLFLVSGLSSAAAFVHMITTDRYEREMLAKADNGFLIFELLIFALFFFGLLSSTRVHRVAAHLLIDGAYAPVFWVFVIGLGIVIPLAIQLLAVNHKVKHTAVAPILVIAGGLILRFVIVSAGQFSNWGTFMLK
ncbi:MAG: Molybdopterin oxidoreductase, Psr/Psh family, PsrC-like membrane anchor subunit [Bacteroidetes bacterium]|nr:Molybdopterin oxidoreductase, Psr/Psh family, PsrC-like membrane anchor subunit [Bacteroidota bacterium]